MSERTELLPGSFCWPELATPDSAKAKAFYAGLFGWTPSTSRRPAGPTRSCSCAGSTSRRAGR